MRYHVDPDELRNLGSGLADIHAVLGGHGLGTPIDSHDLGSSSVATALADADGNWSQARRRLLFDLDHLTRATRAAGATYALVDGASVPVGDDPAIAGTSR